MQSLDLPFPVFSGLDLDHMMKMMPPPYLDNIGREKDRTFKWEACNIDDDGDGSRDHGGAPSHLPKPFMTLLEKPPCAAVCVL